MGIETALILGTVAATAATGYSAYSSNEQAKEAKQLSKDQAAAQAALRTEYEDKQKKSDQVMADQEKRRRLAASAKPQNPNVYTSPLGLPQYGQYGGKTMLGG